MTEQMKSKIHPAMKDICEELNYFNDEFERADFKDGFTRGIKWYLKNLWHDARERPRDNQELLVITDPNNSFMVMSSNSGHFSLVKKWCYLEDIVTLQDEM